MNYKRVIFFICSGVFLSSVAYAKRDFFVPHEIQCENGDNSCIEVKSGRLLNGIVRSYFPSGKIYAEISYANGLKDGKYKVYFESGALRYSGVYKQGKTNGRLTTYYEDGTLAQEIQVSMGEWNGVRRIYYNDGKLKSEENYVQGKKEGTFQQYYSDGSPSVRIVYNNDQPVSAYCLTPDSRRIDFTANINEFKETGVSPCDKFM